jgi:hypothetical protein
MNYPTTKPERETLQAARAQAADRSRRERRIIGVWASGPTVYVRPLNSLERGLPTALPKDAVLVGRADGDHWTPSE